MSINWRQPEIRIVINDKSHGSIDQQCWDKLLRYEFIAQFAVKRFFLNRPTFGEVAGKMADRVIRPARLILFR